MALQIIGAGFGRTGTLSLKVALEELGFASCYHMAEVFENPEHVRYWEAAANGEAVDWDTLFAGYQATTDWPACTYYRELMDHYPEAKVLLSVRDPERWYESASNTIFKLGRSPMVRVVVPFMGLFMPRLRALSNMGRVITKMIWEDTFDGRFEDKEHAIEVFGRHIEEVKASVPSERLLVFEVKEGWEPLCAFLGVDVPDREFPHVNDRASMRQTMRNVFSRRPLMQTKR